MKQTTLAALAVTGLIGAIAADHLRTPPLAHIALVKDSSLSMSANCAGLAEEGNRLLSAQGIRDGSTLTVLATNAQGAGSSPLRMFDQAIPVKERAIFGASPGADTLQKDFAENVRKACEAARPTKTSPILRLVAQGVAHLKSRGCSAEGACYVVVASDLLEDSDSQFRALLRQAAKNPSVQFPEQLKGSIANEGVRVLFCGNAETVARSSVPSSETLARLWKELFTEPGSVSFQPYCGKEVN